MVSGNHSPFGEQGTLGMSQHRFADMIPTQLLSSSPLATNSFAGFMVCPLPSMPGQPWQRQLYEQAFREAQAVVRPSILERLQAATNN
jgi:hypothetical protein